MDTISSTLIKEADAARLPRVIVIWAAAGIFAIGLVIAGVGIYPVYKILIKQQNDSLRIQSDSIAALIEEYLNRTKDVARQVTSRTKAREKLEDYNEGHITRDELKAFSIPILTDALKLSGSMLGITRLDASGAIAVQIGISFPTDQLNLYSKNVDNTIIHGPVVINNKNVLVVSAPILNRNGNKVGLDIITYDFNELTAILSDYSTNYSFHEIYLIRETDGTIEPLFFTSQYRDEFSKNNDINLLLLKILKLSKLVNGEILENTEPNGNKDIISYRSIQDVNWHLLINIDKRAFYAPINKEVKNYLLILILITLIGSSIVYFSLRPLSNRLISLTNKLKNEISEREEAKKSLAKKEQQQATIAEIGQLALSGIELSDLFDTTALRTAETLNVEYCKVLELEAGSTELLLRSGVGWKAGLVGKARVGMGSDSQAGYTLQSKAPVVVEDLRSESRFSGPELLKDHGVVSGISVIIGNKEAWGVFGVHSSQERKFTRDDINFVQAIANCLAEAIQRKRAEDAYRDGQERYRTLYDNNPSMFFTVNSEGIILSVNEYGATRLGYDIDSLIGQPVSMIFYNEDRDDALNYLHGCLDMPDKIHRWELRKVRHDGSVMWVRETARVVNNDGQSAIFIVCEDISEARSLSEKLSYQASHDSLTGLVNRREFEHRLARALETARNRQVEHAMCYLDLDQFKVINDTCGHIAGDQLLKQLSDILQTHVRKTDTLARLGGDEFGLLMEHCDLKQAEQIAMKLIEVIEEFRFSWQKHTFNIGVSIGLIPVTGLSSSTTELLSMADSACYAAKDAGRNRIHIYQADDSELAQRHGEMQWVARINSALDEDRFQIYVQKIAPLKSDLENTLHTELLLRMVGEDGSLIGPGVFLPAAERYNLALRLDRWVVKTIFSFFKAHPELIKKLGICSINLSGQSIADPEFLAYIITHLQESNISPKSICFEITETSAIANLSKASLFIERLKQQGCWFALDDFGSGLSSFAYLKALPVDYLKIDGIFVKDIVNDPADHAMVKSIHDVGKSLGKLTIAEFVENDEIKKKLVRIGIDYAQGYGISRPHPLSDYIP